MATIIPTPLDSDVLDQLERELGRDGVIVVPTDTVYGIGALANRGGAVRTVVGAKGRDMTMPPPLLLASTDQLSEVCAPLPPIARRLAWRLWPGALTLVVEANPDGLGWDPTPLGGTVACRIPDHEEQRRLIDRTGPLAVTSANQHGLPPATCVEEAVAAFGQTPCAYIDSGPTPGPTPSTIVAVRADGYEILRHGAIEPGVIAEVANET